MDAEPLVFLVPSAADAERLRALILSEHGITVDLMEAMKIGTFLLQASVLLAKPRPAPVPNAAASNPS